MFPRLLYLSCLLILLFLSCSNHSQSVRQARSDKEMIVRLEKSFRADDGRTVYPDYFGGISYEDGIYYILVSWITADVIQDITDRCQGVSPRILLKKGDFSQNFVRATADAIKERVDSLGPFRLAKLKYYGYMLMGDRIHVLTGDTSQANVAKFRELVIDSPVLVFDYSSEIVPE